MRTSPPAAIEISGLSKAYGRQHPVTGVSFTVRPGSVTGFLGPNGAGKSTTLRMLVGLTRPSAGRAAVLGGPYTALPNPGRRVGVLLDASAQHAGRTGREVLAAIRARAGPAGPAAGRDARAGRAQPGRGAAGGPARTPWACGSGSASRMRCSATRRC